jgi:hypothetical protein
MGVLTNKDTHTYIFDGLKDNKTVTLPNSYTITNVTLASSEDTQLSFQVDDWLTAGSQDAWTGYVSDEERKKRKDAGECEECGTKREMSRFGLLDCPNHPKPAGPQ